MVPVQILRGLGLEILIIDQLLVGLGHAIINELTKIV